MSDGEYIRDTAVRREALQANMAFQDLGEPIQKLLLLLNAEVSDDDLTLLSKITVRQLAKVFDMTGSGEDPEKILAWLRRTARRNVDGEDPYQNERKKQVNTGASRDPIAFYKEIERRNQELQEKHRLAAEERERKRKENLARREQHRKEQLEKMAEERKRAEESGENTTALDRLKQTDRSELTNTFERFVAKQSTFDNSEKVQDGEWWKKEEYRREFEKLGKKGAKWRSVQEYGETVAPDAELAMREEWYKSQGWWKSDKYRNDWIKTRDVEWWKETPYIRDWQDKGAKGTMWTAADELTGFNRKGQEDTSEMSELNRRIEWYKVNGPKGVQKLWNALAEGVPDRCTLEEKREREDFYKNGDWWRSEEQIRKFAQQGAGCDVLNYSGAAGQDREWWKDEKYRKDFEKGGDEWKCACELAIFQGKKKECAATSPEQEKRQEWYNENWWKAQKYIDDFKTNGTQGSLWRARSEGEAKSGKPKPCKDSEAQARELWYNSSEDREWWKDEVYRLDFEENGENGQRWTASSVELGSANRGSELPASDAEKKKRETWYKQNWWKANRYKRDYLENPNSSSWTVSDSSVNQDKDWWKQPTYQEDWSKNVADVPESDFWKADKAIDDYQKNGDAGKVWNASDALTGSVGKGSEKPAAADELARRKQWLDDNWWRASKFHDDWAASGMKGALWTSSDVASAGSRKNVADHEELQKRQEVYKFKGSAWQAMTETNAIEGNKLLCSPVEAIERSRWHKKNWWKSPEAIEDFQVNGANGTFWRAASEVAAKQKKGGEPEYQATPEELQAREEWYTNKGDLDFWKDPAIIDDFLKKGKEGALWQARNATDSRRAMGKSHPADAAELKKREEWYNKNHWKSLSHIEDFKKNRPTWEQSTPSGADKAPEAELNKRKEWHKKHEAVPPAKLQEREDFLKNQLTDTEQKHRHKFLIGKSQDDKRISKDEVPDLLQMMNQGMPATDAQIKAVEDTIIENRKKNLVFDADPESYSQEEFIHAVADSGFYVPPTAGERKMNEEEALDELEKEEAARVEEEAAFLAMEAEEERKNAGDDGEEEAAAVDDDEEARFLAEQEAAVEPKVNEDDEVTAEQESAWQEFEKAPSVFDTMDDAEVARREAERKEEEERKKAEENAWKQDAVEDDTPEEEGAEEVKILDEDKQDLEAELLEDEDAQWKENEDEEETKKPDEPQDEMTSEEKGTPQPWKLPLPQVTNPQFLKAYFTVMKFVPKHTLLGGKQKRVWVVDHFTKSFYNMDTSGKIKKEHAANKLLQLEKNVVDCRRVRLMFFDASHSYELLFPTVEERERFFESASAIRPSIRVYAPALTKPDSDVEASSTTIDGVGPNTVVVKVPNLKGELVDRELTGECKINSSKAMTEPLTVWTGTFNLSGVAPPKKAEEMGKWIPKGKYDLYAIAIQEGSYQREENEWFQYIQTFVGKEYLTLANMNLWDTYLIVLTRKKNLLKITNVEGSTKATQHKNICGTKGGVGISLRFHETSMCFVTCQLAARVERNAMRTTNLEEIIDCLQLSNKDTDFTQQFHHVFLFGDMNYRVEMDETKAIPLIKAGTYEPLLESCQLNQLRKKDGHLHGFVEAPIKFRPTYRFTKGSIEYKAEKGNAPSYTDRILVKSMPNTWIRNLSYDSCEALPISEHMPVSASYIVRAIRPSMSCFDKVQTPLVRLTFPEVRLSENKGAIIKKPSLLVCSNICDSPMKGKQLKSESALPAWSGDDVPQLDAVNHLQDYLEAQQLIFIVRDESEKRDDKALRGTACFSLKDAIVGKQDTVQDYTLDLILHGKQIGSLSLKFKWVSR